MTSFARTCLFVWICFASASAASAGEIANEIDAHTNWLREEATGEPASVNKVGRAEKIEQLEAAIRRGAEASGTLRLQIQALQEEKESLERVQVVLASGLIGALVTAAVALLGTFANLRHSRAQRDLQRLEVIEKAYQLNRQGVPLPADFMQLLPEYSQATQDAG